MEPELADILSGGPKAVLDWISQLGITSCRDLAYFWADNSDCCVEFEAAGKRIPDDVLWLAAAFERCRRRAQAHMAIDVLALARERRSGVPTQEPSSSASSPLPDVAGRAKRARSERHFPLVPSNASTRPVTVHTTCPAPALPPPSDKVRMLFRLVRGRLFDIQALGLDPAASEDELVQATLQAAMRLSDARVATLTSALRRWMRCSEAANAPIASPSPAVLARFLREVALGGPTAAASMYQALLWFNTNLEANFPLDNLWSSPSGSTPAATFQSKRRSFSRGSSLTCFWLHGT